MPSSWLESYLSSPCNTRSWLARTWQLLVGMVKLSLLKDGVFGSCLSPGLRSGWEFFWCYFLEVGDSGQMNFAIPRAACRTWSFVTLLFDSRR